jgi:hypothetical protein
MASTKQERYAICRRWSASSRCRMHMREVLQEMMVEAGAIILKN